MSQCNCQCKACNQAVSLDFHKTFKIGDLIAGFSTRKRMRITAIGKRRFLYEDESYGRKGEYVAAIVSNARWELITPATPGDNERNG